MLHELKKVVAVTPGNNNQVFVSNPTQIKIYWFWMYIHTFCVELVYQSELFDEFGLKLMGNGESAQNRPYFQLGHIEATTC